MSRPETPFEILMALAPRYPSVTEDKTASDETTLRLILEQHLAGLCSVEQAIERAYCMGRERDGK